MSKHTLLLLSRDNPDYHQRLQEAGLPGLEIQRADSLAEAEPLIASADMVLGEPARLVPLLTRAKALKWMQSTYAGVEALLSDGLRRDYQLTNVRGIFGPLMSEYVFGHLLSLTRHLPLYREQQRQRRWHALPYAALSGRTLLILGTGSIGEHLAATARHFGMKVWGVNRTGREVTGFDETFRLQALPRLLPLADVIVSILPATRETFHLLNGPMLAHCKSNAILFSVGRGSTIDTLALIHSLRLGQLGAAVLDVFEQEPLPASHPLWELPNVIITPHNSAWSAPDQVSRIFERNYLRFVEGQALEFLVDMQQGY